MVDDVTSGADEQDYDTLFLKGAVNAICGEDNKTLLYWKKGLSLLSAYSDVDIDAYVCLMTTSLSELVYYKEREFIEFDPLKYINRISEEFTRSTGLPCKSYIFYNIYKTYSKKMKRLVESKDDTFMDIIPVLFRRAIEYNRDYRSIIMIINEYLADRDYNEEETYNSNNSDCYIYNLVRVYLKAYTSEMSDVYIKKIMNYWNDSNMTILEDNFETIYDFMDGRTTLGKLLGLRNDDEIHDLSISDAINNYVKMYLLVPDINSNDIQIN